MMKWITRERVKVDRVACPWLIKKFVDLQAEFLFVPADQVMAVAWWSRSMKSSHLAFSVLASLICSAIVPAADLTKIDRSIAKEPAYKSKPTYCLLVFGQEAKTRIWLVLDGNELYVDRNRNGDLTDKGESVQAEQKSWNIGEVIEADGKTKHTDLRIADDDGSFLIMMQTSKGYHAEVGNEVGHLQFSERPQDAPIVHLAGPLTVLLRERTRSFVLVRGKTVGFIALIGTSGLGEGASTYYHHDKFEKLNMGGEAVFPDKVLGSSPLKTKIVPAEFRY
jgi:hypothetical protein